MNKGALWNVIQEITDVGIQHPTHFLPYDPNLQRIQRTVLASSWTESIGEPLKVESFMKRFAETHAR